MPNCTLLNQPLLSISQNLPVSPATFALPLPTSAALGGARLHTQGVAMAPGVNSLGVLATNGLTLKLGR